MEIFGLTLTGYGNYFTETLKKDYREPVVLPNVKEILEERLRRNKNKSFSEVYNKLDPILGTADGFSYGSNKRMHLQRKKSLWKPVGPIDMYRIPTTIAQEIGFWTKDSLLSQANWIKSTINYGRKNSEMTKYIVHVISKHTCITYVLLLQYISQIKTRQSIGSFLRKFI